MGDPIYEAAGDASINSLNTSGGQRHTVWFCGHCGHVMTEPLADIAAFYATDYTLGIHHEEEDQLIRVENGREIYRTDYQLATLMDKLPLPHNARILDFGSGKAGTLKKILAARPDLQGHAFDISETYLPFWRRFLPEERFATHSLPPQWRNTMDAVLSFFVLEHVADPLAVLRTQHGLLTDGGMLYCVIPYLYDNPADMLIADHVNHFSRPSLQWALQFSGFTDISIDTAINPQWMVVTARKTASPPMHSAPDAATLRELGEQSRAIAAYWRRMREQVAGFAERIPAGEAIAIYGAGFYGSFIWQHWPDHGRIACFVDRNPHVRERGHKGIPAVPPEKLSDSIRHILVGLNPQVAETAMAELTCWRSRNLHYHYLF